MRMTIHHLALVLCSTCSMLPGLSAAAGLHNPVPRSETELDHIMAWVPADQAPTAGVAQALAHLSLDKALRAAEAELCNGTWQLSPRTMQQAKPRAVTAPAVLGARQAWYYRLSRIAETPHDCGGVDRYTFQRTVSRYLPAWMVVRPAHQFSLWRQGYALAPDLLYDTGAPQTVALKQ